MDSNPDTLTLDLAGLPVGMIHDSGPAAGRPDRALAARVAAVTAADFQVDGTDPADVLRLAGAVEEASEHPVGRAIAAALLAT